MQQTNVPVSLGERPEMKRQILSVLFVVAQLFWVSGAPADVGSGVSTKRLAALHIEQFGVYNALGEISQKAGVVIGVDAIEPRKESTVKLDFPGGTVADLLNMFVSQAPDYSWQEGSSGVIHVSRSNAHVSLLDVVMSYPGVIKRTRREVWEDIAKRQEISAWMQSNGCSRAELFNGKEFSDHNDPISLEARSLTLAQLLDEVAVKSGVDYWAVLQSAPGTACTVNIILW